MGVSGFKKFLNFLGVTFRTSSLGDYDEEIIPIDGTQLIYKQCIGRRGNGCDMTRSDGKIVSHMYSIFAVTIKLLEMGQKPFYVFDGKAPIEKGAVLEERRNTKYKAKSRYNTIVDKESSEAKKNFKRCFHMNSMQWDEVRKILDLMGIPYIIAIGEADQQCAAISAYYKTGVLTEDSDILVFGGTKIFTNFSSKDGKVIEIDRKEILKNLCLRANYILRTHNMPHIECFEHDNFVDFCILMGTDYKKIKGTGCRISGINNEQLFEMFVLSGFSIETLIKNIKLTCSESVHIPQNFIELWKEIKNIYLESEVINPEDINIYMTTPRENELIKFLCDEHEFDRQFVMNKLKILKKYKTKHNFNLNRCKIDERNISILESDPISQQYILYIESLLNSSLDMCEAIR